MANAPLADQIRESLTPFLEPGEQLRAVGGRVILAKQGRLSGKLLPDGVFSVARENVVLKKDFLATVLRIKSPDPKIPKRLQSLLGTGFDKDEFANALGS